MSAHHSSFTFATAEHHQVVDITAEVRRAVRDSGLASGICTIYTPHATAAITINENDEPNIGVDFLRALRELIVEHDNWLHDRVDNNAAAHIKSALIGPSESIPIHDGRLGLGRWQNIFFCEFDGPRREREVVVMVVG